jgi:hypothetical protein
MLVDRSKSGQMEIIGLVIIVILITIGMLFLAQFALKDAGQKKIFTRKGLAYSTMSALMKTTVPAQQCGFDEGTLTLGQQILEDCAENRHSSPNGFSRYGCQIDGVVMHSCQFLEEFIKIQLLETTLKEWKKNYNFSSSLVLSSGKEQLPISISRGDCVSSGERDSSGLFPISLEGVGLVENVLYLCD